MARAAYLPAPTGIAGYPSDVFLNQAEVLMPRKPLRVVTPNEAPPRKLSVAEAAEQGDHKGLLVAMRERIAKAVSAPECPPRDLASLTRRLQDISKELAAITHAEKAEAERGGPTPDEAFDSQAL